jgi:hypothetical protein
MLAIFAPAGLGVRDAALVTALATWIGVPAAVLVAASARTVALVTEWFAVAIAWAWPTSSGTTEFRDAARVKGSRASG